MRVIDFSADTISPELIRAAGYDGVVVYVSESRPGTRFGAKPVSRQYADALRAAGLYVVSNFQYGKPGGIAGSDFLGGFDGGVADAKTAQRLHSAAGGPNSAPIFFSVDDDTDLCTWNDVAVNWFRGINSVLGTERTGIYGHSRVCAWAIQDEVIGRSTSVARYWIWQTKAWSQGERESAAVLFQDVIDTQSNPGPLLGRIRIDESDVLAEDFGQWDLTRPVAYPESPPNLGSPQYSVPDVPKVDLVEGDAGPRITAIQNQLNEATHAGLLVDGEFAGLTRRAVLKFQRSCGHVANGEVGAKTWEALFSASTAAGTHVFASPKDVSGVRESHSFDEPTARAEHTSPERIALSDGPEGAAVDIAPFRMVTGRGVTSSVSMEYADLGIMRWDPGRQTVAAMFGDNFSFNWGQDWQSPSIIMYDNDFNVIGVPTPGNGISPDRGRRQLWPYGHKNPYFDTVLPCDFIHIDGWWHVAVMLSKGPLETEFPPAQFVTEFWRSRDLINWEWTGPKLEHFGGHPGNTMLTFDQIGDYVYIFGTGGLARNKAVWMWRSKVSEFPGGWWEPWGFDGYGWNWGVPNEATPILQGWYGELCFRYIDGNCVLSYLEGGRMTARTVAFPENNWQDGANTVDYVHDYEIQNLYGGYISPASHLNVVNGMKFFVSQWKGTENYRVYLVEGTLYAKGPLLATPDLTPPDLAAADVRPTRVVQDDDRFPLPTGCYWGPLDGPDASWSNRAGTEPPTSVEGLTRWQQAIGINASGVYDDATKEAAAQMQYLLGWMASLGNSLRGVIREQEWDEVINNKWRIPNPEPSTNLPAGPSLAGYDIGWYPGPGFNADHGDYLRIYLHTTENQDWITTAEDVALGQANRQDGSYHFLIDDNHVINTVLTSNTAWGLHLDNPRSIQIAMVSTSGSIGCWQGPTNPNIEAAPKSVEQWMAHDKMLDMVAYTIAVVATERNIPVVWLSVDDIGANLCGVSSHHNYSYGSAKLYEDTLGGKQDTDHWDVPPTFPSDAVIAMANVYMNELASGKVPGADAQTAPAVNAARPSKSANAGKTAVTTKAPVKATKKGQANPRPRR